MCHPTMWPTWCHKVLLNCSTRVPISVQFIRKFYSGIIFIIKKYFKNFNINNLLSIPGWGITSSPTYGVWSSKLPYYYVNIMQFYHVPLGLYHNYRMYAYQQFYQYHDNKDNSSSYLVQTNTDIFAACYSPSPKFPSLLFDSPTRL